MNYKRFLGAASAALLIVTAISILTPGVWAQSTYKTLYKFTGKGGARPQGGVIFDTAGNLYGTGSGGVYRHGVVFKLTPTADGSWTESVLYSFTGGTDGGKPRAGLIFDQAGNLYGTAFRGGAYKDAGTVFKLTPNLDGSWTETVLYSFGNGGGGAGPRAGLIFDAAGNLYGTTGFGGAYGGGVVFELTPNSDGSWAETVLYSFTGGTDGMWPFAGVIFDAAGNLYGTTYFGGSGTAYSGYGTVFELTPKAGGGWTEKVLHSFNLKDGSFSVAGLIFDEAGNLYGTTGVGGDLSCSSGFGCGVVFKLAPNSNGGWDETVLHQFKGGKDGLAPQAGLIFDQAGNLYGTTVGGGAYGGGTVFKLAPNSKGGWDETVMHAFADHPGANPEASLIFDAAGNLYGPTYGLGWPGHGSVFEITP